LDQIARVGVSLSINLKLISREIIFEVFQPIWSRYRTWPSQTDGRTDGRTNDIAYCGITALSVASCRKNVDVFMSAYSCLLTIFNTKLFSCCRLSMESCE